MQCDRPWAVYMTACGFFVKIKKYILLKKVLDKIIKMIYYCIKVIIQDERRRSNAMGI